MSMRRGVVVAVVVWLGLCGAACGEDIPALDKAVGQPALSGGATALAVDDSRIYVAHGSEVVVFARDGAWLASWPISSAVHGIGTPLYPYGNLDSSVGALCASPSGRVSLTDTDYLAVHVYTADGQFFTGWGGPGDPPAQFESDHFLGRISAAPDSSLYLLERGDGWYGEGARVRHYDINGTLLGSFSAPGSQAVPEGASPEDVAAAADGGVWVLAVTWRAVGCFGMEPIDARLYHCAPDGTELASWPVPLEADRIAVDPQGGVWVLTETFSQTPRLVHHDAGGDPLLSSDLTAGARDLAAAPDGQLFILAEQGLPGIQEGWVIPLLQVRAYSSTGELLQVIGDYSDLRARGALVGPDGLTVTPQGEAYVRTSSSLRDDLCYTSHFDPTGALAEIIGGGAYPVYNPVIQRVEFDPQPADFVDAQGRRYTLQARADAGLGRWVIDFIRLADAASGPAFSVTTRLAPVDLYGGVVGRPCAALAADGSLRVALYAGVSWDEGQGTLWVGTVSPAGALLTSWTAAQERPWGAYAVAVDPAQNVYVGGGHGVWKYAADGAPVGRIGGWGGSGDQRDAPGSLIGCANGLAIDATGALRVLDAGDYTCMNSMLIFRYRPGPSADVPWYHWAKDAIQAVVKAGLATGFPDGTYRPSDPITRGEMAVYLARALAGGDGLVPAGPAAASFTDVPTDSWAFRYVEYCRAQGIVTGYPDGLYHPAEPVTRAQMAVYLTRALAGSPTAPTEAVFPDVPADSWAAKYIAYCKDQGVVQGYPDDSYHPEEVVDRAQMAVYLQRAFGLG